MKVYAIGDLHLGFNEAKPMEIFSPLWQQHPQKIKAKWTQCVRPEDLVILCGDLSWAMKLEGAVEDLNFINQLPGKKIAIKGNHDYWWQKITHLNKSYETLYFLQNTSYLLSEEIAICGTRGWSVIEEQEEDKKIYLREVKRLELSLEAARRKGAKEIIVALHYPPTKNNIETSLFKQLIESYPVTQVVYGHLHHESDWQTALQGYEGGRNYHLVAADYLNFTPKYIGEYD